MERDPGHIAEVRRLDELKRDVELEDARAERAFDMTPLIAGLATLLAMFTFRSWWIGLVTGLATQLAISYLVQRKAYKVHVEYERATRTHRYYTGEQSPAVLEHLYGRRDDDT